MALFKRYLLRFLKAFLCGSAALVAEIAIHCLLNLDANPNGGPLVALAYFGVIETGWLAVGSSVAALLALLPLKKFRAVVVFAATALVSIWFGYHYFSIEKDELWFVAATFLAPSGVFAFALLRSQGKVRDAE